MIGNNSKYLLKKTRSKAKMYEYNVPRELHIEVDPNTNELLLLAVAAIGNISSSILSENNPYRIVPENKKEELAFASRFFDAFLQSGLEPSYPQYYLLLGAIAYYLCDYTGSSKVLANKINVDQLDLGCNGIEKTLALLLQNRIHDTSLTTFDPKAPYSYYLLQIIKSHSKWFQKCDTVNLEFIYNFRALVYAEGSPRELLLTDALLSIFLIKIERSALNLLPIYTGLPTSSWADVLRSKKDIYELWPAQIRLGEAGVFCGKSAIIQMPTSSGKTTSMSLVIRSAFLSKRTNLAIVVAPFRALCREISMDITNAFLDSPHVHVNELSDIFETDELMENLEGSMGGDHIIVVVTPEKLIYLLRQDIQPLKDTGLIIFDEAHLFDDSSRGAQYELLISTIMIYLRVDAQKLLLSAVIPNAVQINGWFTNGEGVVIADDSIRATEKSIAIADWEKSRNEQYGYLYFLDPDNRENLEFFVPRIIEIQRLKKLHKNEKQRFFPSVNFQKDAVEYNDIAIALALKLNQNGGVAIFCGRKDSANGVLKRILEIEKRGIDISVFERFVVNNEHTKIAKLIEDNYGKDNVYYKAAQKGVFVHHRGISDGIRIAIEYAMKNQLVRCIVCTSTLAQGVNLPIRYLIISGIYQGMEQIKVRDFHNLIGRAGRAGVYTEGTILLSETFVYSRRNLQKESWRWKRYLDLLNSDNSEACLSQFLLLVRPIKLGSYDETVKCDFYFWALARYQRADYEERMEERKTDFEKSHPKLFQDFAYYVYQINLCLDAIESYLLSFLTENCDYELNRLVSGTFGYFLANDAEKKRMETIFAVIKNYLITKVGRADKRAVFSHTLLSTNQLLELEEWTATNANTLMSCSTTAELLEVIISQIVEYSNTKSLKAVITKCEIPVLANMWINGTSYKELLKYATRAGVLISRRKKEAEIQLSEIIDICDDGFGYASTLVINAISELLQFSYAESSRICKLFRKLIQQMRYGLPTQKCIIIYESGFGDRAVALQLASALKEYQITNRQKLFWAIKRERVRLLKVLDGLPQIFSDRVVEISEF